MSDLLTELEQRKTELVKYLKDNNVSFWMVMAIEHYLNGLIAEQMCKEAEEAERLRAAIDSPHIRKELRALHSAIGDMIVDADVDMYAHEHNTVLMVIMKRLRELDELPPPEWKPFQSPARDLEGQQVWYIIDKVQRGFAKIVGLEKAALIFDSPEDAEQYRAKFHRQYHQSEGETCHYEVRHAIIPYMPHFAEDDRLREYRRLHEMLSDMIEGGRLTEADCPDDYEALVEQLTTLVALDLTDG